MSLHIACVSENTPAWFSMVRDLAYSIRLLGSPLAKVPISANFVGGVEAEYRAALAELEVEVRVVEPMPGGLGPGNKLRMLELGEEAEFDTLIALDCDTLVCDDFSDLVPAGAIGVKPVDDDQLTLRDWQRLCGVAGIEQPTRTFLATSNGRRIPAYFNSGVITIPRELCEPLRRQWIQSYDWLMGLLGEDPDLLPKHLHWFAEQIALALAVHAAGLPFEELPVGMNLPTHLDVDPVTVAGELRPCILHHHGRCDGDGFLLRPKSGLAAAQADALNRARAAHLGIPYDGLGETPAAQRMRAALRRPAEELRARACRLRSWRRYRSGAEAGPMPRSAVADLVLGPGAVGASDG